MMRLGVFSDTHGHIEDLSQELAKENLDALICLGDHINDGRILAQRHGLPLYGVRGNCDWPEKGLLEDYPLHLEGISLLLTHGHHYKVKSSLIKLCEKALQENYNLVLYGHTHMYKDVVLKDVHFINPGSVSLPRGDHEEKSWLVLTLDNGHYHYVRHILK